MPAQMRVWLLTLAALPLSCGDGGSELDRFVEEQLESGNLPSIAAALIVDNEVVWEGYYGFADVAAGRVPDSHTLYPVASVSKMFTAVPVLRLVEEGSVDLDRPIFETFGFDVVHPDYPDTPITLRQLLTHTSGLRDNWPALGQTTYQGDPEISLGQFAREYTQPDGEFYSVTSNFGEAPGADYDYCNAAFALAGHLAEIGHGGMDFRILTRELAFEPLGLTETGWYLADVDASKLAEPYTYNSARDLQAPLEHITPAHFPAGGLRSSVHDLSRFVRALMNEGELEGERIFEADTVREMMTRQVPELNGRQGLVLRYDTLGEREYIGHSGAGIGGSANVLMRPSERSALILLSNGDAYVRARLGFPDGRDAMERILERLDVELQERTN